MNNIFDYDCYNFTEYSITDLLNKYFQKINDCIEETNKCVTFVDYIKEVEIPKEVAEKLNEMLENGELVKVLEDEMAKYQTDLNYIKDGLNDFRVYFNDFYDNDYTITKNQVDTLTSHIVNKPKDNIAYITETNITENTYYTISSFGENVIGGMFDIFINVSDSTTNQIINAKCCFNEQLENVSCKSPFIETTSIIGLGNYRLFDELKFVVSDGSVLILIKSCVNSDINGYIRITSHDDNIILNPLMQEFKGIEEEFIPTNTFSQNYVELGTGYQIHSAMKFENTLTMKDNIVIHDDIMMYPESDEKFSSLRIENGSVIIKNDGSYATTLGQYIYGENCKLRLVPLTEGVVALQVGKGGVDDETDNQGILYLNGWSGDKLAELHLGAIVTITNDDIRLDSRGKDNASTIFLFSDTGYGQIEQDISSDVLKITKNTGAIELTVPQAQFVRVNGRSVLSAISCSSTTRPTNIMQGYYCYDRTVGKPIWWNGTTWIDAMGNEV